MKVIHIPLILLVISVVSCHKQSKLEELLTCENTEIITLNKTSTDFNKTFSIRTSKDWKTKLYYDDFESSIMTADTTKALTNTFIFEVAMYSGDLEFTALFNATLKAKTAENNLELLQENYFDWQNKRGYYTIAKGFKNNYHYQEMNIYINHSSTHYLKAEIQVYGDQNIAERLCSSLLLFNTLKIK